MELTGERVWAPLEIGNLGLERLDPPVVISSVVGQGARAHEGEDHSHGERYESHGSSLSLGASPPRARGLGFLETQFHQEFR